MRPLYLRSTVITIFKHSNRSIALVKTILPSINKNTDDEMPLVETKNEGDRGRKRLKMASILCLFFVICEFTAGIIAKSTAVQADAAHLLTDLFSFLISLAALHLGMFYFFS